MCHVLIIEDDWFIADHIAQLVQSAGALSMDMATSEDEAVDMAIRRPPLVIISDVSLAAGSGPAAVHRITDALGPVAVMFVTGEPRSFRPPSEDMPVLHKPVADWTLVETFRSMAARDQRRL
ncbi:response regulator [Nostoc sp. 3335mG]|nr:response regulator [Nostoc sp. 3335mG]